MADLTTMTGVTCQTNIEWETLVGKHTVNFGKLFGRDFRLQQTINGYTCTCKGFTFRGVCKHVEQVRSQRCGWNPGADPGLRPEGDTCPDCGAPLVAMSVGV
jgi:hypothetical protein